MNFRWEDPKNDALPHIEGVRVVELGPLTPKTCVRCGSQTHAVCGGFENYVAARAAGFEVTLVPQPSRPDPGITEKNPNRRGWFSYRRIKKDEA